MSITTNGWGAVNIAPIHVVNKSIERQKALPRAFTATSHGTILHESVTCTICGDKDDPTKTCSWRSCEIAQGGSGHILYLSCTLGKAFALFDETAANSAEIYEITESRIDLSLDLKAMEDPDYAIPGNTGKANVLKVDANPNAAINILSTTTLNGIPNSGETILYYSMAIEALQQYFRDNLDSFQAVFGVIMLNAELGKEDRAFQWLIPSAVSYAVESNRTGDYFGVLTMIDGDTIGTHAQQIDIQAFDRLPKNANSMLLIGEEKFCKNILLPSASAIITGSKKEDFSIGSDGVSITNNKALNWDHFDTGNGKTITPTLPAGAFDLRVIGNFIQITITGMHYSPSSGITVTTTMTQKIELSIQKRADGKCVLVPNQDSLFNECTISSGVQVSTAWQIAEIVLDVVAAVAAVACGVGTIGRLATKAAQVTTEAAAGTAEISIDAAEIAPELADVSETVSESAASIDAVAAGTSGVTKGGFFSSNFCKVATQLCGAIAGISGVVITALEIAKYINEKNYDKMPALNDFAAKLLSNYAWPQMKDAQIIDAELCNALILYTDIQA